MIYGLTSLVAIPMWLVIGIISVPKAQAASVNHTYLVGSTVYNQVTDWNPYLDVMYTNGSRPGATATTDLTGEVSANPGLYNVAVNWTLWDTQTTSAIYKIWDNGTAVFTSGPINQKLKANGLAGANGDDSGYLSLGNFNLTGTGVGTRVVLSGESADNGNVVSKTVRINHANVPPTTPALISPANNSYTNSTTNLSLNWVPSIDTDEVPSTLVYDVKIDGATLSNSTGLVATTYSLDVSLMTEGLHTWQVVAKDGETTTPSTIRTFTIDRTNPTINSVTGATGTTGESTLVTVTATDSSPLMSEININGAGFVAMTGVGPFTYLVSVPSNSIASIPYIVKVIDAAGNFSTDSETITVTDDDKPVINSIISAPDTTGETSTISVNATDNIGIVSASININGAGFVPMLGNEPNYSYPYNLPVNSLNPINYIVQFSDAANNIVTSDPKTIMPVDDDAPVITSVTGTAGNTGGTTLVTVNATDNIAPTSAQINYGTGWLAMSGSVSPFTYSVPIPLNSTADITYNVKVFDAAANETDGGPYTITVTDNVKPVGSISINGGDTYTTSTSVTLDLSATDNIAVTEMSFRNGTSGSWSAWESYATTKNWTLTVTNGPRTVQARFRDASFNISNIVSDSIILDTVKPTIPGTPTTSPNPTNVVSQLWNWAASTDSGSGLAGYWYRITNGLTVSSAYIGNITNFTTNLVQGVYNFFVRSRDNAGNLSDEISQSLTVDTTPPTQPIATPDSGSYLAPQTVALTSTDALSGLDKIYYTLDNTPADNTKTAYSSPINVDRDETLRAVAYDKAGNKSDELIAPYQVAPSISGQSSNSINQTTATISWTTGTPATSRVIYDTVSHPVLGSGSNYGYADSTYTYDTTPKVTVHSVIISGLTPGTTYYYRAISTGSPETVSGEMSFATNQTAAVTPTVTGKSTAQVATPPATAPAATTTPSDSQGQIKGADTSNNTSSQEPFNWTPWIILIIIIILAGAATGGYFYWTRGDEAVAKSAVTTSVSKKSNGKTASDKKVVPKKTNRW